MLLLIYSYVQHLPTSTDLGSCTENIIPSPCPALLLAVTIIVTSGRLLFNLVILRNVLAVVVAIISFGS